MDLSVEHDTDFVPWPAEVVDAYVAKGYWDGRTIVAPVLAAADRTPHATALVDGDRRLSYLDLASRVDGTALRLHGLGLRRGERMVIQLPNGWEFVVLVLACLRLGIVPVMALPAHRRHELGHLAEQSRARALAVPGVLKGFDHQAMAREVAATTDGLAHVLVAGDDVDRDHVDLRALCERADGHGIARGQLDSSPPDSRAIALMLISGGTTGLPKLIARTHDDYGCYVRRVAQIDGFGPETTFLAVLPLGHSLPLGMLLATLRSGGRVVIGRSPAPPAVFAAVEQERVTVIAAVPAMAQSWLEHQRLGDGHDLSSVELLLVGGARLPDEMAAQMVPALTRHLQQGYGMAEGLVCLTRPGEDDDVTWHTQGRPICAHDELLIVDETGRPVPEGEIGELLTRGPCTPRGYYRAAEHNAVAYTPDGWLRTGDLVRRRPDGNLVVEGRRKDVINRGGEKVSAEEVENFAYQVDGVTLAAAVAMPDARLGERVCLYVVPRPGCLVTLADVEHVMETAGVARFKIPERLVLREALPLTLIGKIDKASLRAELALETVAVSSKMLSLPRPAGNCG